MQMKEDAAAPSAVCIAGSASVGPTGWAGQPDRPDRRPRAVGQGGQEESGPRKVEAPNRLTRGGTALQPSCCEGYVFIPCSGGKLGAKEDDGERAGALPLGEHVPGFPGRDLPRHRPSVSAHGRQPRGATAPPEADRGQGRRRAPFDAGRLSEGPPALRGQRRGGSRAARSLFGELIAAILLVC